MDMSVPSFQLYGETNRWPTPDLLHSETIAHRSRLYQWHIQPHRHADLMHLLILRQGKVNLLMGNIDVTLSAPLIICVPPMIVHGFRFSPGMDGHIITLSKPIIDRLQSEFPHAVVLNDAMYYSLDDNTDLEMLNTLVCSIDDEYRLSSRRHDDARESLLFALTTALTIQLWRRTRWHRKGRAEKRERGEHHMRRYQDLIEERFRSHPSIPDLAEELGISSAHLNDLCRRLTERSAQQLLHERLLLEAKRKLTYTSASISQVSEHLGFSEPTYFTRFFKRNAGMTPKAFRQNR